MPNYKLTYFDLTGLGEPIRFLLHYAGVKFEDRRLSFEEWPKYKADMPMGQMPVLEIDGKMYHQSKAISRYIARKNGLYGDDELMALEIDGLIDSIDDLRQALSMYYWEEDAAIKAKYKDNAFKKLPFYLDKFEAMVKKNAGFFVGKKITWVDIYYASFNTYLSNILKRDLNENHPELKKLTDKINNCPNIKAYLDKRPKTSI